VLGFPRLRVGLGCIKINDVKDVDDASTFLCSRFVRMRKWVPAFSRMGLRICPSTADTTAAFAGVSCSIWWWR
jgi:hypothetical protein